MKYLERARRTSLSLASRNQANNFKNSLIVFVGGMSYGAVGSIVKLGLEAGFTNFQVMFSQVFFGWLIFLAIAFLRVLFRGHRIKVTKTQVLKLVACGLVNGSTGFFYTLSLGRLPASVAITMLFQFTWIGIVIQAIYTKKMPSIWSVLAGIIIFGGTIFASGIHNLNPESLDALGIIYGLLAAISCALFIFLSGTVETEVDALDRGLLFLTGAALLGFIFCPSYFTSGALQAGIWKYGLLLGPLSSVIPVFFFSVATPYLPSGLSTIMASSELPMSIMCAMIILGEHVEPLRLIGVGIILFGVVVAQLQNIRYSS